jgi:hypothetical protein
MKTYEQLFQKFKRNLIVESWIDKRSQIMALIDLDDFTKALTEYDTEKNKECADKIVEHLKDYELAVEALVDEMIEQYRNINLKTDNKAIFSKNFGKQEALTELKEKMMEENQK